MTSSQREDVTEILQELRAKNGDTPEIHGRLYQAVYLELRKIAAGLMHAEAAGHTLQPTALVHEAYLKLLGGGDVEWQDRKHFLGVAARAMRQILVDHARRRGAVRRGARWERITLDDSAGAGPDASFRILELDRALGRLAKLSKRMALVAEWRIFCGLSHDEIAAALSVSSRTAANDWSVARRWLTRELVGEYGA